MERVVLCNNYTLRLKDIPLVSFALYRRSVFVDGLEQQQYFLQITKVYGESDEVFPKSLPKNFSSQDLLGWIKRRKAPKNRQFVEKITAAIEEADNPLKYVDVSHALSLNDAFWITNDLTNDQWQDFNLYHHSFDEVLAYVAFTGYSDRVSGVRTTPELTSNGMLKKSWSNRPNGIYLLKGDDFAQYQNHSSQAVNEYYACQVAEVMGNKYVPYDLEIFHHKNRKKELICLCPLFTSEDVGYVTAYDFLRSRDLDVEHLDLESLEVQKEMGAIFGQEQYGDMMLFDTLIGNKDRHLGNFGVLVNNNTGEVLGMAPLFDNGYSLLYGAAVQDLQSMYFEEYIKTIQCKYLSLDLQAQFFVRQRHVAALKKLQSFHFQKHLLCNYGADVLEVMGEFVRYRAKRTLELLTRQTGRN